MVPDPAIPGAYKAVFNSAQSSATCDGDGSFSWSEPSNGTAIGCASSGRDCLPSDPKYGCTGEFSGQCTWDNPDDAQKFCGANPDCKGIYCTSAYSKKRLCFGRSSTSTQTSAHTADQTWHKVYANQQYLMGHQDVGGLVNLTIAHDGTKANITMSGPDWSWFAVGMNAQTMADLPYAIVVDGTGKVSERKLGSHAPGSLLASSVTVESNTVIGGVRTVTMSRAVGGATKDHYTIPSSPGEINVITATGNTPELAYHKARTGGKIVLLPTSTSSCVCSPTVHSYLTYMNKSTAEFEGYNCADEPRSDMLRHGDGTGRDVQNAACAMSTYNGGLKCCAHQNFLTDIEQDSMIPDETDTYFLKWRYYFQEYVPPTSTAPASHKHLHHWVFLIDQSVNDYEEDNAHYGTASIGKIEAHLTASQMGLEDIPKHWNNWSPFVMTPHCHAPSCIREELGNADTNTIICNMTAKYGDTKYGPLSSVFNEQDYVAILPCIYGDQPGIQSPFVLKPDTNITAIKYFNNTYRHLGQMAQWTG